MVEGCKSLYGELEGRKDQESVNKRQAALRASSYSYARLKETPLYRKLPPDPKMREFLEMAEKLYPSVTEQEYERSLKQIGMQPVKQFDASLSPDTLAAVAPLLAFSSIVAAGLAFLTRGGPLLHLFAISVQTNRGQRAGRLRCLLRTLVAWSPALLWPVAVSVSGLSLFTARLLWLTATLPVALFLLEMISMVLRPERAIQDRVAGTVLVPR